MNFTIVGLVVLHKHITTPIFFSKRKQILEKKKKMIVDNLSLKMCCCKSELRPKDGGQELTHDERGITVVSFSPCIFSLL